MNTKEAIFMDVEASLKALGTDYIDVIQLDANTDKDRIFKSEPREAFTRLKEQGKVRFCGAAVHKNPADVVNALANDTSRFFDTVLVAYNFKSGKGLADAVARAAKTGMGIIAMKTQAGGYATDALGKISPNQAALKWILQDPHVATAVPGMRDLSELKEDAAVMGMSFAAADQRILQRYSEAIQPRYCRMCGGCDGTCPQGVDISTINRALMYAEGSYQSRELALATYREIPPTASASECLECGECVARCVNGLNIPAKMAQMTQVLRG
ncbi:MAG: aldo/keto reductase [Oryzomonas sp.]